MGLLLGMMALMNTHTCQHLRSHLLVVACSYVGMYIGKLCSNPGNTKLGRNELSSHSWAGLQPAPASASQAQPAPSQVPIGPRSLAVARLNSARLMAPAGFSRAVATLRYTLADTSGIGLEIHQCITAVFRTISRFFENRWRFGHSGISVSRKAETKINWK